MHYLCNEFNNSAFTLHFTLNTFVLALHLVILSLHELYISFKISLQNLISTKFVFFKIRRLLPLTKGAALEVMSVETYATRHAHTASVQDKRRAYKFARKERISQWELIEGVKNASSVCLSWYGASKLERRSLLRYDYQQQLLVRHKHSSSTMHKDLAYFKEHPVRQDLVPNDVSEVSESNVASALAAVAVPLVKPSNAPTTSQTTTKTADDSMPVIIGSTPAAPLPNSSNTTTTGSGSSNNNNNSDCMIIAHMGPSTPSGHHLPPPHQHQHHQLQHGVSLPPPPPPPLPPPPTMQTNQPMTGHMQSHPHQHQHPHQPPPGGMLADTHSTLLSHLNSKVQQHQMMQQQQQMNVNRVNF